MSVCRQCQRGNHQHDHWTNGGGDAGCPNQAIPGDVTSECECRVIIPAAPSHRCPTCGRAG